ncbi:LOW QUALITY PROTEIN: glycoside hydrolase [Jimgerdemannia flammicorona]|uniref:alpha-1,2-Mannosidase n=1 Tax=Jimgerdemannia flammicorona TaxID=994334 RepID=A0A433DIQ3_9FUNG|nr:LOW QUALITY PROTEIN: glycoside hydrolase [Jimgerdemannia flammicorona]
MNTPYSKLSDSLACHFPRTAIFHESKNFVIIIALKKDPDHHEFVLAGDLDSAIKSHLFYYNIWRKYRSLPERFDFYLRSVNIATYPLRPEFVESTYFLYRATRDPFYLRVGEMILEDLNNTTRVACGFATVGDVIGRKLEDRMESFALSETFKYLFLLFDVEGHILPLPRQYLHSKRHRPVPFYSDDNDALTEISAFLPSPNSCPVYQPGQTPSRHHHYHRRAHPQKLSHTNIGLTPLTAFSRPTYPSSSSPYTATTSTTFSHHAHSAILSRPDADFARELVGLDDDHIPPLDPRGYCEAPNLLPQTVELTFGYPAGTTSNGNNQAGQQGHAQQQAADTQDVGWSPTVVKFLGGLVATTLAGLKVELTKRSSRQGAGYDVTKG